MMEERIVLVDEQDEVIGYAEKMSVHRQRLLHRAFSIFVFDWNSKKMLLQKRASCKYHSGGLWTNACCSHPHENETMEDCLNSRLMAELGLETNFRIADPSEQKTLTDEDNVIFRCGKFSYFADFGEICENEIDYVFLYSPVKHTSISENIRFNEDEIEEISWVTLDELNLCLRKEPNTFTAWFKPAFDLAYKVLCQQAQELNEAFNIG